LGTAFFKYRSYEEEKEEGKVERGGMAESRGRDDETPRDAERQNNADAMRKRRRVDELGEATRQRDVENRRQKRENLAPSGIEPQPFSP
jgi:hypothetical protein